jgi:hypothetical protein
VSCIPHRLPSRHSLTSRASHIKSQKLFRREWKPEVLIRSGFFDKVPYFVLADELERNNDKLKVQVQELLDKQAEVCKTNRSPTFETSLRVPSSHAGPPDWVWTYFSSPCWRF